MSGARERVLAVSKVLVFVWLCIVFKAQSAARAPIAPRSRKVILLSVVLPRLVLCERLCFCVHPPVTIRVVITSVVGAARVRGLAARVERLLDGLAVVGVVRVLSLVLPQMADVSGDEP